MPIDKIGASFLVVGLIVGVASGYGIGFAVYQQRISQLESDISTKDAQISQLQSDLTSLQGQVNILDTSLLHTLTKLEQAMANTAFLLSNISSLETKLEETQAQLMPGRIPVLDIGSQWIRQIDYNATTYTMTESIIGEGVDYYLICLRYDPPYMGQINETRWIDKSTHNPIRIWGHASYTYDTATIPYIFNSTFSYTYIDGVPFPLYVEKKLNMTEKMVWNMTWDSTTHTYIMNNSYTYKVESIENVTVPAGTFTCFKIDVLNATSGEPIYTVWYSDEVKYYVKSIDYTTTPETTYELKDYSV